MSETIKSKRLESLDVLRGFDLFLLVFFQPILGQLTRATNSPVLNKIYMPFTHIQWEGFHFWDIIMPLFMFMAGVSMPFAFSKYSYLTSKKPLYKRIIKRVVLLWIFGMFCQGQILDFDIDTLAFYSNVLQTIAVGYAISAIFLLHLSGKWQIIATALLLTISWAMMSFASIKGFGGGNYTPDLNLAEGIDRLLMGRFRDQTTLTDSGIDYGSYRYTWIFSSMNFVVTVMTGVFAGQILKKEITGKKKLQYLFLIGATMIVAGLLLSLQQPIIKKIWTSSMTLYSSGICFLLMAIFYYIVDYKKQGKYLSWLKIFGMNSIMAYMLREMINFSSISYSLFHGLEEISGAYFSVIITTSNVSIAFLIVWYMYKKKIFLKV